MKLKYYQILLKNKKTKNIFKSHSIYNENDILKIKGSNDIKQQLIRYEYLKLNPDDALLYREYLDEELSNIEIFGKLQINIEEF